MNERDNTARKPASYDNSDQLNVDPRLVDADFIKNQGLSAKGFDPDRKRTVAANDAQYEEEAANEAQYVLEQIAIEEAQNITRRAIARKQAILNNTRVKGGASKLRAVGGLSRWVGLGIACTAYAWQFACAAISLVGIGAWGVIDELANGNILGRMANWAMGLFGTSIQSLFPAEYIALGFWALATLIALCTFFAFLLWFFLTGVHVFDTPITAIITALTFACCIMPVANLFPWVPLWVIYMNLRATVQTATGLIPRSG